MFYEVGSHLHFEGKNRINTSSNEAEYYLRSAFNRYYYAAHKIVTDELRHPFWRLNTKEINHTSIPTLFETKISKRFQEEIKTAKRAEDLVALNLFERAKSSSLELAKIMRIGYTARQVADYQFDQSIDIINGNIELSRISIELAKSLHSKSKSYINEIMNARKQCDE